ncbi:MAG: HisA/HisF-related TIM barrel protein [Thermaerobacter sp.]|nr:HisA/HisF-related TIM barrel protein [Thermaerobacter sp.]
MPFTVIPSVPVAGGRLAIAGAMGVPSGGSSRNPLAAARYWLAQGARRLHFEAVGEINLEPAIPALVLACRRSGAVIQVGGGVRNALVARTLCGIGADHLVVRAAASDPERFADLIGAIGPEHIIPSWAVPLTVEKVRHFWEMVAQSHSLGVNRCTLSSSRAAPIAAMVPVVNAMVRQGWEVWVAGRIRTRAELKGFEEAGAAGAILGTALYRGELDWRMLSAEPTQVVP